jgi:hypothetical protein
MIKIKGNAGTAFVADTTGLHRGMPPKKMPRSILQFIYFTGPIIWEPETLMINL